MFDPLLVRVLRKEKSERIPFWFMRQAGRYLPEYKALRATTKGFLDYCYTPEKASEATLQPIKRFDMDAAIIFSDILVVPHAMGVEVAFEEGEGPRLTSVTDARHLETLSLEAIEEKLAPVYEALKMTRAALAKDKALIGFAGAPWTLACYMVEGRGSKTFEQVKKVSEHDALFFDRMIGLLTKAVIRHLDLQVKAGAQVLQLFDSWAGVLSEEGYRNWVVEPAIRIVSEMKKRHPQVPMIGFPRQSGMKFLEYAKETGIDAVSIDGSVSPEWAKQTLQPVCVVQGMLEPQLLVEDKAAMLRQAKEIVETFRDKPFVFNLSHGILPPTPLDHVAALCEYLKSA